MAVTINTGTTAPTTVLIEADDININGQFVYIWEQVSDGTPSSANSILLEPIRKEVESDESVVIRYVVLTIDRAPHVDGRTSAICGSQGSALSQRPDGW